MTGSNVLSKLILAGVSEQVNIPINICIERGIFKEHGIEVEFRVVPQGTGKMLDLVEEGAVDIAITVADAFIAGKGKGRPIQLCGTWVNSPLVWAVAGRAESASATEKKFDSFDELKKAKIDNNEPIGFGISRQGSGSHTMAHYLAQLNEIPKSSIEFGVHNDFKGLREGVDSGAIDAFMWEVFTTKPWFDSKELQYLGEVPTPWPAFVFVSQASEDSDDGDVHEIGASVSEHRLSQDKARLIRDRLFPALHKGVAIFQAEAQESNAVDGKAPPSIQRIVDEFGHTPEDAWAWFRKCEYASDGRMRVDTAQLTRSVDTLKTVGLVPDAFAAEDLWTSLSGKINPVVTTDDEV